MLTLDIKKMFIRKCSIQLIRDVSGITPSSVRMFQPLGQNQTFTVHGRPMMHMLFETCAPKELNKFKVYAHAAGGKRFWMFDSGLTAETFWLMKGLFPKCPELTELSTF